jgi:hypothetical protein
MVVPVLMMSCQMFEKMKRWSGRRPNYDDKNGYRERPGASRIIEEWRAKTRKRVLDDTKEISRSLFF